MTCSVHGEMRNAYTVLFGKPEGNCTLAVSRNRWECNSKMNLKHLWCELVK
jgi:hypothetical protein